MGETNKHCSKLQLKPSANHLKAAYIFSAILLTTLLSACGGGSGAPPPPSSSSSSSSVGTSSSNSTSSSSVSSSSTSSVSSSSISSSSSSSAIIFGIPNRTFSNLIPDFCLTFRLRSMLISNSHSKFFPFLHYLLHRECQNNDT